MFAFRTYLDPLQIGEVNPLASLPTQPGLQVPARVDSEGGNLPYIVPAMNEC